LRATASFAFMSWRDALRQVNDQRLVLRRPPQQAQKSRGFDTAPANA
jgi:hypothetical protein